MSYWGQMTKTASIEEPGTATLDDANVATPAWETAVESRCALMPMSARAGARQSAQQEYAMTLGAQFIMFVPRETSIGPQTTDGQAWRVTIDGVVYMTVWVEDLAGKGKYTKAYLRRDA